MDRVIAVISMLHEGAGNHSAARLFRRKPVLDWTLRRLTSATSIETVAVLCWDDQVDAVIRTTQSGQAGVINKGPRQVLPGMAAVAAARRWADGWRSGLLGTCEFDLGFHPLWVSELMQLHEADAVLLVDPASAFVDAMLAELLIDYSQSQPEAELCFMQAAPGLAGTLLRRALVDRLTIANVYPGRLLTYFPDQHGVDPIGKPGCAPVPTLVARSPYRFKLDSDRQVARADRATVHLNGHLISTEAEELAISMRGCEQVDPLPREVVLELNTARASRPTFWPGRHLEIERPEMTVATAIKIFSEIGRLDDIRLTIGGVGDPLLSPACFDIIAAARSSGIQAIGIETDLISATPDDLRQLVESGVDVISIQFPAASAPTYSNIMGVDRFSQVFQNIAMLEEQIKTTGRGIPLIAMDFQKMQANLGEMELWYDYWIRRFGHAVIVGPSDFAGQIPDLAVADMASPVRQACSRLSSRMTILSDGRIVSCEQDILGKQVMGRVGEMPIQEIWQQNFGSLRKCHASGDWRSKPLCGKCREWHRV